MNSTDRTLMSGDFIVPYNCVAMHDFREGSYREGVLGYRVTAPVSAGLVLLCVFACRFSSTADCCSTLKILQHRSWRPLKSIITLMKSKWGIYGSGSCRWANLLLKFLWSLLLLPHNVVCSWKGWVLPAKFRVEKHLRSRQLTSVSE